jgi:hypothetical protein
VVFRWKEKHEEKHNLSLLWIITEIAEFRERVHISKIGFMYTYQ